MNKDRKILLIILFLSVLFSLSAMNIIVKKDYRSDLLNRILLTEQKLQKLNKVSQGASVDDVNELKGLIEKEKSRFFDIEESDPYKLGIEIKDLLEKNNITVKSYKTIEEEHNFLIEFSIAGNPSHFFSFMQTLYEHNKNYRFPFCSIRNESTGISADFRIGYAFYE